jgi:uncharacterized membrane protein
MTALKRINHSTGKRLIIALLIGILATFGAMMLHMGKLSYLIGWDIAVLVFVFWVWLIIWPMNHERTAKFALREDPSRAGADIVLICAAIASLGAVGFVIFQAHSTTVELHDLFLTGIGIASVVVCWVLIHTIYTLRYATLYYSKEIDGYIDFKHDHKPAYSDFAYFAFTIGMTYQVADTDLVGSQLRKMVLRHSLLAYLFGTVIIATTISLIAGLGQ